MKLSYKVNIIHDTVTYSELSHLALVIEAVDNPRHFNGQEVTFELMGDHRHKAVKAQIGIIEHHNQERVFLVFSDDLIPITNYTCITQQLRKVFLNC